MPRGHPRLLEEDLDAPGGRGPGRAGPAPGPTRAQGFRRDAGGAGARPPDCGRPGTVRAVSAFWGRCVAVFKFACGYLHRVTVCYARRRFSDAPVQCGLAVAWTGLGRLRPFAWTGLGRRSGGPGPPGGGPMGREAGHRAHCFLSLGSLRCRVCLWTGRRSAAHGLSLVAWPCFKLAPSHRDGLAECGRGTRLASSSAHPFTPSRGLASTVALAPTTIP